MATKAAEQFLPLGGEEQDALIVQRAKELFGSEKGGPSEESEVVLPLSSLMQDERGEIVLYNDSNLRSLAIATDVAKSAERVSGRHTTKSGEDVTGFRFVTFVNGVKIYFQDGLRLEIRSAID